MVRSLLRECRLAYSEAMLVWVAWLVPRVGCFLAAGIGRVVRSSSRAVTGLSLVGRALGGG